MYDAREWSVSVFAGWRGGEDAALPAAETAALRRGDKRRELKAIVPGLPLH